MQPTARCGSAHRCRDRRGAMHRRLGSPCPRRCIIPVDRFACLPASGADGRFGPLNAATQRAVHEPVRQRAQFWPLGGYDRVDQRELCIIRRRASGSPAGSPRGDIRGVPHPRCRVRPASRGGGQSGHPGTVAHGTGARRVSLGIQPGVVSRTDRDTQCPRLVRGVCRTEGQPA